MYRIGSPASGPGTGKVCKNSLGVRVVGVSAFPKYHGGKQMPEMVEIRGHRERGEEEGGSGGRRLQATVERESHAARYMA